MLASCFGFVTAFVLAYLAIPVIIRVSRQKKLYDRPNARSAHDEPTPSLGGIAIFAGAICGIVLWAPARTFGDLQYILAALLIIFLLGVRDDLIALSPMKKLLGQVLAAIVLIYQSQVKITTLEGVAGVQNIPEPAALALSVVAIVGIVNAFNLIDGINGLAGSIGLLACITWGAWFLAVQSPALAVVAFSLAGAITAFLKYNFTPAQIFMGDTGSLLIGTVCAILAINFIEMNRLISILPSYTFEAAPAIAVGILILPLYDTVRVFVKRILQGRSPFSPDKTHIHHLMLDLGMSHSKATAALLAVNVFFIILTVALGDFSTSVVLVVEIALMFAFTFLLQRFSQKNKRAEGEATS